MRLQLRCVFVLLAFVGSARAETITVSAAISLKESLTQIAADYKKQSGDEVTLSFGASGQLAAQISQGAPVDAFISAGVKEMDQLAAQDLIVASSRRDVCGNELVLIVPSDAAFVPKSFADLTDGRIKRIAVGQPSAVPAGQYAAEVFAGLKLEGPLTPKLVFGENVRQVLDYVMRGEVEAGVVYSTDALAAGDKVRVAATADGTMHQPIVYPAAVITASAKATAAGKFLDYLGSDAAETVLAGHGFIVHRAGVVHVVGVGVTVGDWSVTQIESKLAAEIKPVEYSSRGAKHQFSCVPLISVLGAAGVATDLTMQPGAEAKTKNPQMRRVVLVKGRDGYGVVFSLPELMAAVGNRTVWVALEEDGKPLAESDGPVRLIVPDDNAPARAVHEVGEIEVVEVGAGR